MKPSSPLAFSEFEFATEELFLFGAVSHQTAGRAGKGTFCPARYGDGDVFDVITSWKKISSLHLRRSFVACIAYHGGSKPSEDKSNNYLISQVN